MTFNSRKGSIGANARHAAPPHARPTAATTTTRIPRERFIEVPADRNTGLRRRGAAPLEWRASRIKEADSMAGGAADVGLVFLRLTGLGLAYHGYQKVFG